MNRTSEVTAAKGYRVAQVYADAHDAHYVRRDLATALASYHRILADHPDCPEAGYARAQVRNIVHHVVPGDELVFELITLAHVRLREAADNELAVPDPVQTETST